MTSYKNPLSVGSSTQEQTNNILANAMRAFTSQSDNLKSFDGREIESFLMTGRVSSGIMRTAKENIKLATPEQVDQFLRDLLLVRGNLLHKVRRYLDAKGIFTPKDLMRRSLDEKREILEAAADFAYETIDYGVNEEKNEVKEDMILRLLSQPLVLQRPNGSSKHHLIEFIKATSDIQLTGLLDLGSYHSFVIEHDWLAAFTGTPDFDGDEMPPLPFERCCFEFLINGVRILVFVGEREDGLVYNFISIGHKGRWFGNHAEWKDGKFSPGTGVFTSEGMENAKVSSFLRGQIRAVCIMLDAEVAVREVRRVSEKLNRARAKAGKTLLKDFHVVSLAKKFRADRTEPGVTTEHARKRCHWRRGHWRHYADHKTWIKWMLVGDPALGFVEKSYRA